MEVVGPSVNQYVNEVAHELFMSCVSDKSATSWKCMVWVYQHSALHYNAPDTNAQ